MRVTVFGVASMTLTGTTLPSSAKIRVIPSFRPINPAGTVRGSFRDGGTPCPWTDAVHGGSSHLDLDVDAGRERQSHQRIDRLRRRIDDVDEALVRPDLELLAAVLVHERAANDRVLLDPGRQRHRPGDVGAGALRSLHDLLGRLVEQLVVGRLQTDANALLGHAASRGPR